jgi:hypothetical protein
MHAHVAKSVERHYRAHAFKAMHLTRRLRLATYVFRAPCAVLVVGHPYLPT